jgi:hypothetical protein
VFSFAAALDRLESMMAAAASSPGFLRKVRNAIGI